MGDAQSAQREGKKDAAAEEESGKVDDAQTQQTTEDKSLKSNKQISEINGTADASIGEVNGHCEDEIAAEAILSPEEDVFVSEKPLKEEETPLENVEINEKDSPTEADANEDESVKTIDMNAKQNDINESFRRFFSNIGLKLTVKRGTSTTDIATDVPDKANNEDPNKPENVEDTAMETICENAELNTDVNTAQETCDKDSTTLAKVTSEDILENAEEKATPTNKEVESAAAITPPAGEDVHQDATAEEAPRSTSPCTPKEEAAKPSIKRFFKTGFFSGIRKRKKPAEDEITEKELVDMTKKEVRETTEQTVQDQQQDKEQISPGVGAGAVETKNKENKPEEEIQPSASTNTPDELKSPSTEPANIIVTEPDILNSQEKEKVQASPLKRLLSGSSLKKLKKQRSKKSSDGKLSDSGEHVSDQLLSSTESQDNQKEEGPAQPCAEAAGDEDGAWISFKKLTKRHKKRSSLTNEETHIQGSVEQPSDGEQISDRSTEEGKKRKDSSVSWEAVLCGSGKKRGKKTSDSEEEEDNKDHKQESGPKHDAESPLESSNEHENEILAYSPKRAGSPSEGDGGSTWKSLKRLVTPKRKAKDENESKENIQSDSEVTQDESSLLVKKLLPERKRRKSAEKQDHVSSDEADKDVASGDEDSETPAVVPLSEFDTVETAVHLQTQADIESHKPEEANNELQQDLLDQMAKPVIPCDSEQTEAKKVQDNDDASEKQASTSPATKEELDDLTESISKHQQLSDIPEEGIITETMATPASVTEDAARDDTIAEDLITEITSEAFTAPEPASDSLADETEMVSAVSKLSSESSKTSGNTTPVPAEYEIIETDALLQQVVENISISPNETLTCLDEPNPEKIAGSVSQQILESLVKEEPTILEIHRRVDATAIKTGLNVEELDVNVNKLVATEVVSEVQTEEFNIAQIAEDKIQEINVADPAQSIKQKERIDENHHLVDCLSDINAAVSPFILPEGEEMVPDGGYIVEAHQAEIEPPKTDSQEADSAATEEDETTDGAENEQLQIVTEEEDQIMDNVTDQSQVEDKDQPPVEVEELQEVADDKSARFYSEEGSVQTPEKEVTSDDETAAEIKEETVPLTQADMEREKKDELETDAAKTEHVQAPETSEVEHVQVCETSEVEHVQVCETSEVERVQVCETSEVERVQVCETSEVEHVQVCETSEVERVQVCETSEVERVQLCETSEVERVQVYETSEVERVQVCETSEVERVQVCETSEVERVQVCETSEVELVQLCETPEVERVQVCETSEVEHVQVCETSKVEHVQVCETSEVEHVQVCETSEVEHVQVCETSEVEHVQVAGPSKAEDVPETSEAEHVQGCETSEVEHVQVAGPSKAEDVQVPETREAELVQLAESSEGVQASILDSVERSVQSPEEEGKSEEIQPTETVTGEPEETAEHFTEPKEETNGEPVNASKIEHVQEPKELEDVQENTLDSKAGSLPSIEKEVTSEDIPAVKTAIEKADTNNLSASVTDEIKSEVVAQLGQPLVATEYKKTEIIPQDVRVEQEDCLHEVVEELHTLTAVNVTSVHEESSKTQAQGKTVPSEESPASCVDNATVTDETKHKEQLTAAEVSIEQDNESEGTELKNSEIKHAIVAQIVICNLKEVSDTIPDVLIKKTPEMTEPLIGTMTNEVSFMQQIEAATPLVTRNVAKMAEEGSVTVPMRVPSLMSEGNHRIQVQVIDVDIKSAETVVDPMLEVGIREAKEVIDVCHEAVKKVDNHFATPETEEELLKEENRMTVQEVVQYVKENLPETLPESVLVNFEKELLKQSDDVKKVIEVAVGETNEVDNQKVMDGSLETFRESRDGAPVDISDDSATEQVSKNIMQTPDIPGGLDVSVHKEDLEETKVELDKSEEGATAEEVKSSSEDLDVKKIPEQSQITQSPIAIPSNPGLLVPQNTGIISSIGNVESPSSLLLEFKLNIQFGQAKAQASPTQTDLSEVRVQAGELVKPTNPTQKAENQKQTNLSEVEVHAVEPVTPINLTQKPEIEKQTDVSETGAQVGEPIKPINPTQKAENQKQTDLSEINYQAAEPVKLTNPTQKAENEKQTDVPEAGVQAVEPVEPTNPKQKVESKKETDVSEAGVQAEEPIKPMEKAESQKQTVVSMSRVSAIEPENPINPTQKSESLKEMDVSEGAVQPPEVIQSAPKLDSAETSVITTQHALLDAHIQALETGQPEEQIKSTETVTTSVQATEMIQPVMLTEKREVLLSQTILSEACPKETKAKEPVKQTDEENDQDEWMDAEEVIYTQEETEVILLEVAEPLERQTGTEQDNKAEVGHKVETAPESKTEEEESQEQEVAKTAKVCEIESEGEDFVVALENPEATAVTTTEWD